MALSGEARGLIQRLQILLDDGSVQDTESKLTAFAKRVGAALGIAFGIRQVVLFGEASIKAAAEAESAWARFEKTMARIGGLTDTMRRQIEGLRDFANLKTPWTDERVLDNLSTLVQKTGDYALSQHALQTAMNLSVGAHIDLESAIAMVARGLNGNLTLFQRQGITIKEGLPLLKQLDDLYGGQLAAHMGTFAGKLEVLGNLWDELKEQIGAALIDAGGAVSVMDVLTASIQGATTWVKEHHTAFRALGVTFQAVGAILGGLVSAFEGLANVIASTVMTAFAGVTWALYGVVKASEAVAKSWAWIQEKIGDPEGARLWRERAKEIGALADQLERVAKASWREGYGQTPPVPAPPTAQVGNTLLLGVRSLAAQGDAAAIAYLAEQEKNHTDRIARNRKDIAAELTKQREALQKIIELEVASAKAQADAENGFLEGMRSLAGVAIDAVQQMYDALANFYEEVPQGMQDILDFERGWLEMAPAFDKLTDPVGFQQNIERIDALILRVREIMGTLDPASAEYRAWDAVWTQLAGAREKQVAALAKAEEDLAFSTEAEANAMADATDTTDDWRKHLEDVLGTVGSIASALLGVLDTLGLADDATRQLVTGVGGLADGIRKGLQGGFSFTNILGIAGAGLSLLSGIGGMLGFGESEQEKAWNAAMEKNSDRLQELRMAVERLTTTMTGAEATRISQAIGAIIAANPNAGPNAKVSKEALLPWLQQRGISWNQFLQGASALGITLTPDDGITLDQLKAYFAALPQTAGGVGGTFAQQRQAQQLLQQSAPGTVAPADALSQYIQLLATTAPDLFGSLAGVDLRTPEGIARVQRTANELAMRLASRRGIPLGELGGLTEQDLRQAIADLSGSSKELLEARKQALIGGEETGVKDRQLAAFGEDVTAAIDAASRRGGAAAEQAKRVADLYSSWLNIRATAAGGPEGALAMEAYQKLTDAMGALDTLMGGEIGISGTVGTQARALSVQRAFTVAQADVVAGELRTANVWLERMEGHLAKLVARTGPLGGMTFGDVYFQLPASALSDPTAYGREAAATFDVEMGARYQQHAILAGDASLG